VTKKYFYITVAERTNLGLIHTDAIDVTPFAYVLNMTEKTNAAYVILGAGEITEREFKEWKKLTK